MSGLLNRDYITDLVRHALAEDIGSGDITTLGTVGKKTNKINAVIYAQAQGILAGLDLVKEVFRQLNKNIKVTLYCHDGEKLKKGKAICAIKGPAGPILSGERTALNYLGLLSGIATTTSHYVAAVRGTKTQILDTRKTIPGMRHLIKYAVNVGGGTNHRIGLYDAILIKDNHIEMAGSITQAVQSCKKKYQQPIEVEVETIEQVKEALNNKADIILLDNFKLPQLKQAVKLIGNQAKTEVSGGVTLSSVKTYADLGVDRISTGAITHSFSWLPVHMEFE